MSDRSTLLRRVFVWLSTALLFHCASTDGASESTATTGSGGVVYSGTSSGAGASGSAASTTGTNGGGSGGASSGTGGSTDAGRLDSSAGGGSGGVPPTDASTASCGKRGIAAVFDIASAGADLTALAAPTPGISWFYGWSRTPSGQVGTKYVAAGVEWVPMVWGQPNELNDANLASRITVGPNTKYLLGYNEPNFTAQANLTPAQAAAAWPYLQKAADQLRLSTVAPAVNFCGGGCNQTNPFVWLDQFLAACSNCRIDFVAFHSYACDSNWFLNTYMKQAVDKYYTQGNPPRKIWLTEFACADSAPAGGWSVTQIQSYLGTVIPWLESQPAIFRYAWFGDRTGRPNDPNYVTASNALLAGAGTLTALGNTYTTIARGTCP